MWSLRFNILCGALCALAVSCRSVKPRTETSENLSGDAAEVVSPARKRVAQAPKYSDLLLWDRLTTTKENSPARSGVVRCRVEDAFVSCFAQGAGSGEVLLDSLTSQGLRQKIIGTRQDIENDARIMADVQCDMAGGKLPPYSETDAKCEILRARAFNEIVIENDVAFEVLASMRGDEIIAENKAELSGVLSCRVLQRNINAACTMRRVVRGGISDDARELPLKMALTMSEMMFSALSEIQKAQSRPPLTSIPAEIAGAARCLADGKTDNGERARSVVCYVRL